MLSIRITAVPGKVLHNSVQTLVGETWRKEISGVVVEVKLLDAREIACAAASVFDFCTSKASKLSTELQRQGADLVAVYEQLAEMNGSWASSGVSICKFVLVKKVKLAQAMQGVELRRELGSEERLLRQYLYLCTSKASKLRTSVRRLLRRSSHDRSVYLHTSAYFSLHTSAYVSMREVKRLLRIAEVEGRQKKLVRN